MPLRLFNTLTKSKDDFAPIDAKNVRMYVCGPTVYDFAHIGNARPAIVFDLLYRLLRHEFGPTHVTYVRNITDVDDNVTEKTEAQYHADVGALGCLPSTHQPRATEFIPDMMTLIGQLLARGHAYEAGGEVLFDTQSMPDYGRLSGRKLDEQQAGARIEVDAHKKHAHDFVLWKQSAENEPGWESPWGRGRPGWHIECSAMSAAYLGQTFDIHGGGLDLIFPHHENEIAQSRCAHGTPVMANVWMHNGFLQVEGEKMSKSAGNFFTIRELLADWPGEVLRFNMLRTHYRQPIDFTLAGIRESWKMLERWYALTEPLVDPAPDAAFLEALLDDLNTPAAIASLHQADELALAGGLGFMGFSNVQMKITQKSAVDEAEIYCAIETRKAARAAKNFAESDRIRDDLLAKGIVLKDRPQGTTWEAKR